MSSYDTGQLAAWRRWAHGMLGIDDTGMSTMQLQAMLEELLLRVGRTR